MSSVLADARFDWPRVQADIERLTGISEAQQPRLRYWYSSARQAASAWLANDFVDADGADVAKPQTTVDVILLALAEGVRAQKLQQDVRPGVVSVTTGATSETYGSTSDGAAVALGAMANVLYPLRRAIELL